MDWTKTDFGHRAETPHGVYEAHRTPSGRFVFRAAGEADSKPGTLANVKEWASLVNANRAALAADPRGDGPAEVRELTEVSEVVHGMPVSVQRMMGPPDEPACTGVSGPEIAFCEDLNCPRHGGRNRTDPVFWPSPKLPQDADPNGTWDLPAGDSPSGPDPDPDTVSTLPEPTTLESAMGTVPTGDPDPHDHDPTPNEDPLPADEGDPPGDPVGGGWDPLFPPCAVPLDRRNRPVLSWLAAA